MSEEEFYTTTIAATLAKDIRIVAEKSRNEEELRIGVENLLELALKKLGISANPRYEKRISRTILTAVGRVDALYGQAVIEYEPPGKLSTARGKHSTKKQIEGYLLGLAGAGKQREDILKRIAGIALDGQSIFSVRYRAGKPLPKETIPKEHLTRFPLFEEDAPQDSFVEIGPYQITEESINKFLMYLRALRRSRLTAEELGKEFGPEGEVAHQMVKALYARLEECLTTPGNIFPRMETLYEEWKRIFGIVYGQELAKAQKDAFALARLYYIDQFTDLKPLLFAVHTKHRAIFGVFWLKLKDMRSDGILAMVNLSELGKREIERVDNFNLEPDLVYPAIWGRDISRWRANPEIYILVIQDPRTREGYLESHMKNQWPETYRYLQQFEDQLRNRAAFIKYYESSDPFYSQFNVSSYTFKSHKVIWKRMASDLVSADASTFLTPFGDKVGIGTDTTSLIHLRMRPKRIISALLSTPLLLEHIFVLFHQRQRLWRSFHNKSHCTRQPDCWPYGGIKWQKSNFFRL